MSAFNQTVTVVNHLMLCGEDCYKKTVLKNCMWKQKTIKNVENNQLNVVRYYSVTILLQDGYTKNIVNNEGWTLNAKNNQDLLILGEFNDEITPENYKDVLKMDNVGIINSVSDNTTLDKLKHWKVICI